VANRTWPPASEARLVAVRKDGPRDPRKDAETTVALDSAAKTLGAKGLAVSIAIRDGKPQDVLLREAREFAADCIFIESRGLDREVDEGYGGEGLGNTATALVLGAHCSVEIVRAKNFGGPFLKPAA